MAAKDAGTGKRRGRPAKSNLGAADTTLTLRIRHELYEEIREEAEKNARSISAQAEMRLRQETQNDVGRIVGKAVDMVERLEGKSFLEDESVRRKCRMAIELAVNLLLGEPLNKDALKASIDYKIQRLKDFQKGRINRLLDAGPEPTVAEIKAEIALLSDWTDSLKVADDVIGRIVRDGPK